ncbi:YceI family protein [Streptomyces sp. LHD-70]|nr:YceI family protein [Streptomyces sp. LHD-70]MDQ8706170.1 YceI family protein [Streptomyces sp. LHD-70]
MGRQTTANHGKGPLSGIAVPPHAGLLTFRVLDPLGEPLGEAKYTLSDSGGRKVVKGETDPFGWVIAVVPLGDYRLSISSDGYTPYRGDASVHGGGTPTALGDISLHPAPNLPLPEPGEWEVEAAHTRIGFSARHIGLGRVYGSFGNFAGAIRIGNTMEHSAMHVVIDTASIDTKVRMRDNHLRSADFLDVERFPTLEFYSDRFTHRGGHNWAITGALTLHGVTRTVTLDAQYNGIRVGMEGETRGAVRATTELHREDYTINWQTMLARNIAVVGSSINVDLDIQIVPKGTELEFK